MNSFTPTDHFRHWILERHAIYVRRYNGEPAPWTTDPILAQYRFCNVYRQLDRVTAWLNRNWFNNIPHRRMLFWTCAARLINAPEPLEALRPDNWWNYDQRRFIGVLDALKAEGKRIRGSAYIVSTNGHTMPFPQYITTHVLNPIWQQQDTLIANVHTLNELYLRLTSINGFGSFMAGQVIADMKYWHPAAIETSDWAYFVVPGPGSKRGLNRLMGREPDTAMSDKAFARDFPYAMDVAQVAARSARYPLLHAQDVQNCLCEFDKYERARLNQGRPKQNFTPYKMY